MKIEYNGEMVEAYDLVISKKTAEQIIRGEKTCDIRDFTKFYQDKFGDPEKVKQNIQAEKEGRDDDFVAPFKDVDFVHFRDYGTFTLDVRIDFISFNVMTKEDIEYLNEEIDFHDFDNEWQQYAKNPDKAPAFFILHIDEVIRQSDDNERVWKKRSRY